MTGTEEAELSVTLRVSDPGAARSIFSEVAIGISQIPGTKEVFLSSSVSEGDCMLSLIPDALSEILQSPTMRLSIEKCNIDPPIQEAFAKYPNDLRFDRCSYPENARYLFEGEELLSIVMNEERPSLQALYFAFQGDRIKKLRLENMRISSKEDKQLLEELTNLVEAKGLPFVVLTNPDEVEDHSIGLIFENVKVDDKLMEPKKKPPVVPVPEPAPRHPSPVAESKLPSSKRAATSVKSQEGRAKKRQKLL